MADVLLMQDSEPPFRLAAFVLREGGHNLRILAGPDEALAELSIDPPDVAVLNLSGTDELQRHAIAVLHAVTRQAPIIHLGLPGHEDMSCECDCVILAPYTGPALLGEVTRLTARA